MKKINKINPSPIFSSWANSKPKSKNANEWYGEIYERERWDIINELAAHNAKEQFYICCYCCGYISGSSDDTMNEHVEARRIAPERSLDYTNIVASCKIKKQCDSAHGSQPLPLTPLMPECESEFRFKLSGRVEGITRRASQAIDVLNLGDHEKNNKSLVEKRKQLVRVMIIGYGIDFDDLSEDKELYETIIDDLMTPKDGRIEPYSPVVANMLRKWIS